MLFDQRKGRSDLTQISLGSGFEMHEGIFTRAHVPRSVRWYHLLFGGPNCFLLTPEEHRPDPPDRVVCYWLSVARYGKQAVDFWVDSLPFKSTPSKPWNGTSGHEVAQSIMAQYNTFAVLNYFSNPVVAKRLNGEVDD